MNNNMKIALVKNLVKEISSLGSFTIGLYNDNMENDRNLKINIERQIKREGF